LRPKSVDAVLVVHVLHLIENLRAVVAEAAAAARKKLVVLTERYHPPAQSMSWAYGQAIRARGALSARRWVQPEIGIGMIVRPRKIEAVVRYEEQESADAALSALERKLWAITWDVPDDVHRSVVAELSSRFRGTTITHELEVLLLSWDTADFTEKAVERIVG
jgi:hypothetical protein